jgi:hypothetical protein
MLNSNVAQLFRMARKEKKIDSVEAAERIEGGTA